MEESGYWQVSYMVRFIEARLDALSSVDIAWKQDAVSPTARRAPALSPMAGALANDRSIIADPRESEELLITLEETTSPSRPLLGVKITRQQSQQLLEECQSDQRSNIFRAPSVTLFNGASCWIADEALRPFVTGVRANGRRQDGEMEPIIEVLPEGIRIRLHGTVTKDHRLAIECRLMLSEIGEVEIANLPFGRRNDDSNGLFTVQAPRARTISVRSSGMLNRDESLLIVCPEAFVPDQSTRGDMASCYLVTPMWFSPVSSNRR